MPDAIYTDDEVAQVRGLVVSTLDGLDKEENPWKHGTLHKTLDVLDAYIVLRNNLQEIYNLPGRQQVGHPWISRLTTILRETFFS